MSLHTITSANFEEEVLKATGPVLVDFYADWCGPCKAIAPIVEEMANEGVCKVCKLNVDNASDVAMKYRVLSIPTVIVFVDGEVHNKTVGLHSKEELMKLLP